MKKISTLLFTVLTSVCTFAATEQAWYNDVTSITNNGQYYIYSVNGNGFMQAGQAQVKSITTSNYTSASTFKFTIANPTEGTVKSGNYYLKCYREISGTSSGPTNTKTENGTNIIFTSMNNGEYWNIHGHYNVFGERYPALYYKNGEYNAYLSGSGLIWSNTKDTQTATEYRWYVVSQAQLDRHFAIYFFDAYKETLNIEQYSGKIPAAYYTALEAAYNQTFSVQNAEHSAEVVNAAKTELETIYNGAADVATAYATATGAINTLEAVEDKGDDFAEVTTDLSNARTALEQAMTIEAINAAVANLKAIDPISFSITEFAATASIEGAAASQAGRAIIYAAADTTIIYNGVALQAGTTTLTATAEATDEFYKFVRSVQVTVTKLDTLEENYPIAFCEGDSAEYRGKWYFEAGEDTLLAEGGVRDTMIYVTVTIYARELVELTDTVTVGDALLLPEGEWTLGEAVYTEQYIAQETDVEGLVFVQEQETVHGCKAITTLSVVVLPKEPDTPTSLEAVRNALQTEKFFHNGVLYIRRGERLFTTEGREVK